MLDPLSITTACLSITATVPTLMMRILAFVSEVKGARKDLDGVHRELSSLQLCLNALRIEDTTGRCKLPPDIVAQTCQILVNIETTMRQISNLMDKLGSGRLGRRIQWAATEREEMAKLRSSLESNKTALEISLSLGTVNMLVEQNEKMQAQQDQTTKLTEMTQDLTLRAATIDGKVDGLLARKDNSRNIERIQDVLTELKEQLTSLAASKTKLPAVERLTQLATDHTMSSFSKSTVSDSAEIVQVVQEIQTVKTIAQTPTGECNHRALCLDCRKQHLQERMDFKLHMEQQAKWIDEQTAEAEEECRKAFEQRDIALSHVADAADAQKHSKLEFEKILIEQREKDVSLYFRYQTQYYVHISLFSALHFKMEQDTFMQGSRFCGMDLLQKYDYHEFCRTKSVEYMLSIARQLAIAFKAFKAHNSVSYLRRSDRLQDQMDRVQSQIQRLQRATVNSNAMDTEIRNVLDMLNVLWICAFELPRFDKGDKDANHSDD